MEQKVWIRYFLSTLILLFTVVSASHTFGQFEPPVSNSYVTATFMEFRSTGNLPHFHMGVDFSTFLREGVEIRAAEDGYVVRLEIDEGGFTETQLYFNMKMDTGRCTPICKDLLKRRILLLIC